MSPKTKFNLLLEADQIAALREIQNTTGAPMSEQIRRAIADWITRRGSIPDSPAKALLDELDSLAALPMPKDAGKQKIHASVRRSAKSLRRTLARRRELDAIERGERTNEEVDGFLAKTVRVKSASRRASTRRKA